MSGLVVGLVLRNSKTTGAARMVLTVIADSCHEDGTGAWPSMTTIAARAGLSSDRSARRAIEHCVTLGELVVEYQRGGMPETTPSERPNRYTIPLTAWKHAEADSAPPDGASSPPGPTVPSPPDHSDTTPGPQRHGPPDPRSPKQSLDPSFNQDLFGPTPTPKKRASRIPDDWYPSAALLAWSIERLPRTRTESEIEQFRDHHLAKGSTMVSWDAAFRTWVRNAERWRAPGRAQPTDEVRRDFHGNPMAI